MNLKGVIEGILFAVGDEGITLKDLVMILDVPVDDIKNTLVELKNDYEKDDRGIRITFLGNSFKLTTKKEHKEYYQKLIENPENNTLSSAALETLAIVAYNQPITRVEIDEMRGVSCVHIIRRLVAKGLIKEAGKSTMPGRPNLYATTSEFLDYFGLSSINDLPKVESKEIVEEDQDLFTSIYKEQANDES